MSIRRDFPDLPPIWTFGTIVAGRLAAALVPWPGPAGLRTQRFGTALIAAGVGMGLWSALWFRRKRTTIEPRERPRALIVEGPFRLNRNPIYSGMVLVAAGAAMRTGSLPALVVAAALPVVLTRRFVRSEEAALVETFGDEALRYIARTRRW